MTVDTGQMIRDRSGRFACPNNSCWLASFTTVVPTDAVCPKCGTALDWTPRARQAHAEYQKRSEPQ